MTQTEIEVAYVNAPKPGAKTGNVKTTQGEYYSVWPEKLGMFAQGARYVVEYESRFSEDGSKEWKTIKKVVSQNGQPVTQPPRRVAGPASAPQINSSASRSTSEEIAVMGIINHALHGSGTVPDALTLTQWVKNCRRAWRDGFAATLSETPPSPPFDDEVPF